MISESYDFGELSATTPNFLTLPMSSLRHNMRVEVYLTLERLT